MRKLVLLILCLGACKDPSTQPLFIENADEDLHAQCDPIDVLNARGSVVTDLVATRDSNILVLYGDDRELVTYDRAFNAVSTVAFEREGPRGVREAVSADTDGRLFYIADAKQLIVKILDSQGQDRGAVRLDFIPRRLRSAGGSIVVAPFVAGNHPPSLLYELRAGRPQSLSIPVAHYENGLINAFANMSSVAALPDGRVLVMHETIVPFGYSVSLGDASSLKRFAIPLPARQRPKMGNVPSTQLTDKNIGDLLAVALAATSDPVTGHAYYLTQTGRRINGSWEKMVVELDSDLRYVKGAVLGMRPQLMTFAPARRSLLLIDDTNGWFECKP